MATTFPDLSNLSANATIVDIMALPNSTYPFFWTLIMIAIWIIITLSMYHKEKEDLRRGNLLSSMAVSAFGVIMLSTIGTLFNILTLATFLPLLVGGLVIIATWLFSSAR
ncbi:hypothetical protein LCGC14_1402390 [marine sediment metagenome]|uniref:Uncharacterized protein n=1 Tax=marine sediment metagenome TaxID=412755 RepID=A0A0F9JWN5_9ZZZZ